MTSVARSLSAIFMRDLQNQLSYRLSFALQFILPSLTIFSFYFIGKLMNTATISGLSQYGGDYFSFALVGLVLNLYVAIALGSVRSTIRTGQTLGFLEVIMTTRTGLVTFLTGSSLYGLVRATVIMVLYLAVGAEWFHVQVTHGDMASAAIVFLLSIGVMVGLGVLSGAFILMFKQGDPLTPIVTSGGFLLSGVVYPIAVLPDWLRWGSVLFPQTYALEGVRMAILQGASLSELWPELRALLIFALVIVPASIAVFQYAVKRARQEGSFAQF